ncbi:MAG: hypothetical protein WC529_07570 [Candidatus Margulisiibacteriota bacterium]
MSERHGSNLLEGLLLGGMIGAALGVLFAPAAGARSRAALQQMLSEVGLDGVVERFSEAFEAGKEEIAKSLKEGE